MGYIILICKLAFNLKVFKEHNNSFLIIEGMSSLYTITVLAAVRFISTIQYDNSWYVVTREKWFTLRCVQLIWIFSLILAIPPTVGIGEYVKDIGMIRYQRDVMFNVIVIE